MALFAISDLHLSFSSDKPMDVFKGWENYTERLEKNWRAIVKDSDTVVIPGDISWAMRLSEIGPDFDFIESLPGQKIILKGNHDLWWDTLTKMNRFIESSGYRTIRILHNNAYEADGAVLCGSRGWFYDAGEPDIKILNREAGRLRTSIEAGLKLGSDPLVFLHYPPVTADRVCMEIFSVFKEYEIKRCYYGHIHGAGAGKAIFGEYDGVYFKPLSCDLLGFVPHKIL